MPVRQPAPSPWAVMPATPLAESPLDPAFVQQYYGTTPVEELTPDEEAFLLEQSQVVPRGTQEPLDLAPPAAPQAPVAQNPGIADAMQRLNDRELESLRQQGLSVEALEGRLADLQKKELPMDLSGLAVLADAWGDGNSKFTQAYRPQETAQDRAKSVAELEKLIAGSRNDLSENEVGLLRSQLNSQFQMENLDYSRERDAENQKIARERLARMGAGRQGGKILPSGVIGTYTDAQTAVGMASSLKDLVEQNRAIIGPQKGRVGLLNPYSGDQRKLMADFDLMRQKIGKMIEGGVLRKEDEAKYARILPVITDTPDVAKSKAIKMEAMLKEDLSRYMANYGKAGYDVSGFSDETERYRQDAAELRGPKTPTMTREQKIKMIQELQAKQNGPK
jgi:hypothetical protein